jgi:predicted nucleotidyltransferase
MTTSRGFGRPHAYTSRTRFTLAGIERDKGDDVLDLKKVDFGDLAEALEDHSYDHSWWLDPKTGEVVLWSDHLEEQGDPDPETRGLRAIDAIPSHEGYEDMQDFIQRVRNGQARNLLERAIAGRGAFRRFKDTLLDFPELREAWFRFHDARVERRAIWWLVDEGLIDQATAERAIAERPDPELPELSGPFDPHQVARDVARDLRRLYGDRLSSVLLFGSWARGDAHPESDIDLLVVLDEIDSVWDELRRMDSVLWRHSFDNDTVVTALPVAKREVEERKRPVLVRAQAEGLLVD